MSSKVRNAEKRRENEAAYQRDYEARMQREANFEARHLTLTTRLEELGIDRYDLINFIKDVENA